MEAYIPELQDLTGPTDLPALHGSPATVEYAVLVRRYILAGVAALQERLEVSTDPRLAVSPLHLRVCAAFAGRLAALHAQTDAQWWLDRRDWPPLRLLTGRQDNPLRWFGGVLLQQRRAAVGWTADELGRQCGLTAQQVLDYEAGPGALEYPTLARMATALQVPVETLMAENLALLDPGEIARPHASLAAPLAWEGVNVLRQCREAAGLSQESLAEAAGLGRGAVRALESGRRANPLYRTLAALANALQINLAALLLGDATRLQPPVGYPYPLEWSGYGLIRQWREERGLTLHALSEQAQLNRAVLRSLEAADPPAVTYSTLASLANGLGVPLVTLIPELTPPARPAHGPGTSAAPPVLWTVAEAAAQTGATQKQLYQLIARGLVSATWRGKTRVILAASLEAWVSRHQHDGRGRGRKPAVVPATPPGRSIGTGRSRPSGDGAYAASAVA
jgi:transcriptional regulator with XRE-family HTH domain